MIDQINLILKNNNYYKDLINEPKIVEGQSEPFVLYYKGYNTNEILYSVVVPIFNQENIVVKNTSSIINNIEGNFELIIILDNCIDSTQENLLDFLNNTIFKDNFVKVIIVKQETPIFETSCDNIGFVLSSGKYILEIQADMEMIEYGFNEKMCRAFNKYDDIIGISGRCTHTFVNNYWRCIGKIDFYTDKPLDDSINKDKLYIYGTCNRGPLLLDRKKLVKLQYLDEQNFVLDDSDHDLFARAYYLYGWKCGYVSIDYNSPLINGSMRKELLPEIKEINKKILEIRKNRSNGGFLKNIKNLAPVPIEIRDL